MSNNIFSNLEKDYLVESARAVPAVTGTVFSYMTLNNFVAILTIIYIIFQLAWLINKWIWAQRDRKDGKKTDIS